MKGARGPLGIRLIDVGLAVVVLIAVEINVATGGGPGAAPLNALAYIFGGVLVLPVLLRHRWPRLELIGCSVLLLAYYLFDRRNISPAPLLSLPLYDAAVAGYLRLAIVIPAVYMLVGLFVVGASTHQSLVSLASDFLPSIAVLFLAITLGEVVRSRRALAAETAERLRVVHEEREAETARRVAEERLRIARDLHDTVAHSMATITVQAGSALHLLDGGDTSLRRALTAIRATSKEALAEMRATLGQLRTSAADPQTLAGGLDRLPTLREAVTAAGAPVTVEVEGDRRPLPRAVDQAAYRILQESLTNVLRHAGQAATATVSLRYGPEALEIRVADDGGRPGDDGARPAADGARPAADGARPAAGGGRPGETAAGTPPAGGGHGLTGMAERAAAIGGNVTAGPRPEGGFEVVARLPLAADGAGR
ncbi:MAG TPA: sensor histidine kinase [Streptosporangiaceae bacterium]|nr:sensor histidine kinase [Streptosporangiaceae bacterium]